MQEHIENMMREINEGDAQLFDVREHEEWLSGHLVQAELVPLSGLEYGVLPREYDKTKKTYLHCRSGVRVFSAAPLLKSMGFTDVIPLHEGFQDLVWDGVEKA